MPVVVIGNVYVGGTGKTPMVIATVEGLRARGFNPGVVSRGYGAKIGPEPRVRTGRGAGCVGIRRRARPDRARQRAPVSVHPKRALAAQALLRAHPDVDVIVSDDGLQHLALARDVKSWCRTSAGSAMAACCRPARCANRPAGCAKWTRW